MQVVGSNRTSNLTDLEGLTIRKVAMNWYFFVVIVIILRDRWFDGLMNSNAAVASTNGQPPLLHQPEILNMQHNPCSGISFNVWSLI